MMSVNAETSTIPINFIETTYHSISVIKHRRGRGWKESVKVGHVVSLAVERFKTLDIHCYDHHKWVWSTSWHTSAQQDSLAIDIEAFHSPDIIKECEQGQTSSQRSLCQKLPSYFPANA